MYLYHLSNTIDVINQWQVLAGMDQMRDLAQMPNQIQFSKIRSWLIEYFGSHQPLPAYST